MSRQLNPRRPRPRRPQQMSPESYVREMPHSLRVWLASRLDVNRTWEQLAVNIPQNYNDLLTDEDGNFPPRYDTATIMVMSHARNPTMAILDDWCMENCQIKHLIQALINSNLLEAADHISNACRQSQQEQIPLAQTQEPVAQARGPIAQEQGDAVQSDQLASDNNSMRENVMTVKGGKRLEAALQDTPPAFLHPSASPAVEFEKVQMNGKPVLGEEDLIFPIDVRVLKYNTLSQITGNFNSNVCIGSGGFAEVFLGEYTSTCNGMNQVHQLAVKRLRDQSEISRQQFDTEVKTLCTYKHDNLVNLLGYSCDGPLLCLVFEFVERGSLQDRLECVNGSNPLSSRLRLDIARGTARGIEYLHDKRVTHRDIKTANILLDADFKPKLGDFATARVMPPEVQTSMFTETVIGSKPYLAPEVWTNKVQPSMDIYSFGVVILELLTGQLAHDVTRNPSDLKVFVNEHCAVDDDDDDDDSDDEDAENSTQGTIFDLLDRRPGVSWDRNRNLVEELYQLSKDCLEVDYKRRINIKSVLDVLNNELLESLIK